MACQYTVLKTGTTYSATDFDDYLKSLPHEVIAKYSPVVAALLDKSDNGIRFSKSSDDNKWFENSAVLIDAKKKISFDFSQIKNRRFAYNPKTKELVLGAEGTASAKGGLISSHAQEVHDIGAKGKFDDFYRGWIGNNKREYKNGIIQFAPAITKESLRDAKEYDNFIDTIDVFVRLGANEKTKLYNAGYGGEKTLGELYPSSLFSKSSQQTTSSTVAQVKSWLPKRVQGMLDSGKLQVVRSVNDLPANLRGVGEAMFHAVWHGSPHDHNKFDSAKIGTGEGAAAFGYGHYFTDGQEIAEWYRDKLSKSRGHAEIIIDGKVNNDELINRIATNLLFNYDLGRDVGSISKQDLIDRLEDDRSAFDDEDIAENADDAARAKKLDNLISQLSKAKDVSITLVNGKGKLYHVELAPTQDEYLDWDKPLSEQSEFVKKALEDDKGDKLLLAKSSARYEQFDPTEELKAYDLYKALSVHAGSPKKASDYLHSIGIRGIRYKADGGKSDANNYVIFSDDDITITNKYSQLNGIQGLYDVKTDKTYLVADMLTKDNTNIVLSHELFHRFYAKDTKAKAIMNKMMFGVRESFDQASRGKGSKTELSAYQRVIKAKTPEKDQVEEYLAYQISSFLENPKNVAPTLSNLIKNWIASIRMALLRYGMDMGFVRSLTPRDLVALSQYGARVDAVVNSQSSVLAKASKAGYEGNDTGEAFEWLRAVAKGLDMSKEARMARAKAMGFDVDKVWYHGTTQSFTEFKANEYLGGVVFVSSDPKEAENFTYAKGGNIIPLFIKKGKMLSGVHRSYDEVKKAISARKKGYDSFYVRDNAADTPNVALLNPNQARSIFAAFDPDFADSPNLLASTTDKDLETLLSTYANENGAPSRAELAEALRQYRTIESQYFNADGTLKDGAMIAPNGEPTKLNRQQWITVRTENFKNWFGQWDGDPKNASKVVDDVTKEPLIVYHGTGNDFTEFSAEELGTLTGAKSAEKGFFFSDNKKVAESYTAAGSSFGIITVFADKEQRTWESKVFKTKKYLLGVKGLGESTIQGFPNWYSKGTWINDILSKAKKYPQNDISLIESMLNDVFDTRPTKSTEELLRIQSEMKGYQEGANIFPIFLNIRSPAQHDFENKEFRDIEYNAILKKAIKSKKDGAILKNTFDGGVNDDKSKVFANVFVAFNPNQIKSATANTGTFGKSNDIRFSVAPRRLTDAWIDWWNNSMFARTDKETGRKEPIKFYHATNAPDLTFFDKEKLGSNTTTHATSGLGFFFSPIKEDVQQYGSNLVEVYLSANKVYSVNFYDLPMFDSLDEAKKFSKSLQKKGYDGIWLKDAKYAIVFESNQAKLTSNEEPTQSPDIRASFAGENAQTADKYQLSTAQERIANGEDAEQVRKDTGWLKGVDGKWRFEIDDSDIKFTDFAINALLKLKPSKIKIKNQKQKIQDAQDFLSSISDRKSKEFDDAFDRLYNEKNILRGMEAGELNGVIADSFTLREVLDSKKLTEAYPFINDIFVDLRIDESKDDDYSYGHFNSQYSGGSGKITLIAGSIDELKGSLMHEIQHAIQNQEGFASGGSPNNFTDKTINEKEKLINQVQDAIDYRFNIMPDELKKLVRKINSGNDDGQLARKQIQNNPKYKAMYADYFNAHKDLKEIQAMKDWFTNLSKYDQYQRLAGEIEARNTQSRLGLTAEQRRNTPPSKTQDIPDSEAIVVWNNVEMRSEPANAIPKNYYDVAEKFNIPVETVVDIASTSPETMIDRWKDSMYPSNTDKPTEFDRIPMGTVALSGYGDINDRYVNFMDSFDVKELGMSEYEEDIKRDKTYKDYLKWAKEGLKPPYITAFTLEDGSIQSINRRRVLAAKEAGVKTIDGWHGLDNKETGLPLKYGDVKNALNELSPANADSGVRFSVAGDIETGLPEETSAEKFQRKAQDKFNRFRVIQEYKEIELAKDNGYTGNNIFDARQFLKDNGIKNVIRDETDVYQAESINAGISTEKVKDFEEKVMKPLVKEAARAKIKMADISDFLLMRYALSKPELGISTAEANNALHHYRHRTDFSRLESIADKWQQQTAIAQQEMIRAGMSPSNELLPIEIPKQRSGESDADYNNRLVSSVKGQDMVTNIIHDYEKAINAIEKNKIAVTAANFIKEANDPAIGILNPSKAPSDGKFTYYVGGVEHTAQFNDELLARAFKERGMEQLGAVLNMTRNFNNFLSRAYTAYSPTFLIKNPIRDAIQGMITNTSKFGLGMASDIFKAYPHAAKELWNHFRNHGSSAEVDRYRRAGGSTGAAYLSDVERLGSEIMDAYNEYAGAIDTYNRVYLAEINAGSTPKVAAFKASFKAAKAGLNETPLIGHFMKFMENANSITENALRLATFTTLVNSGYSDAKAAAAAKDLMNFNRKGELGSQVGSLYLFFNPSAQGSQVLFSALKTNEHKRQALALAGIIALSAFLIAETMRGGGDDDEEKWKMLPNNLKDRNFIFGSGDTKIMIPVPYGYGVFHSFGNAVSDVMHGESTYKASIRMAAAMFDNFSPFGNPIDSEHDLFQLMPTIPKMVMSPSVNENNFGSPIQPDKWSNAKPDSENMYRGTKGTIYSTIARGLNELSGGSKYEQGKISISPETLKFWTTTLTGGTGTFFADTFNLGSIAVQGVEPSLKDVPIAKAFAHEISVQDARQAFWKNLKEAQLATDEFSLAKKAHDRPAMMAIKNDKRDLIALAKVGNRYQKMAASTRDQIDRIRLDDSLTLQQKRDKQKALESKEMAVYAKFLAIFDKKQGG